MQSLDENFSIPRLERYLVMISEGGVEPVILLSKSDLLDPVEVEEKVSQIKESMPHLSIIPFSNENMKGLDEIVELLTENKTYCLLGSSGVGKTTFLNRLSGKTA